MSLEKIKDKLSECYKKNKPVLLYGDNSAGCIDLIHGIHIGNGGIRDAVEYVHVKEEPDRKVFLESIKKEFSNAQLESYKEVNEIYPRHDGIIDIDLYNSQFGMMVRAKLYSIKEDLYCKVREAFKSTKKRGFIAIVTVVMKVPYAIIYQLLETGAILMSWMTLLRKVH